MASKASKHPAIGLPGTMKGKAGIITAVKHAPGLALNRKTMIATNENWIQVKFQPDDGSRAFWSSPMIWRGDGK